MFPEKDIKYVNFFTSFNFLQVLTDIYWIVTGFALFRNELKGWSRRCAATAIRLHHLALLAGDDVVVAVVDVVVVKVVAAAASLRLAQNFPVDYRHLWWRGRHRRRVHEIPCKVTSHIKVILWQRDDIHVWRCDTFQSFFSFLFDTQITNFFGHNVTSFAAIQMKNNTTHTRSTPVCVFTFKCTFLFQFVFFSLLLLLLLVAVPVV